MIRTKIVFVSLLIVTCASVAADDRESADNIVAPCLDVPRPEGTILESPFACQIRDQSDPITMGRYSRFLGPIGENHLFSSGLLRNSATTMPRFLAPFRWLGISLFLPIVSEANVLEHPEARARL